MYQIKNQFDSESISKIFKGAMIAGGAAFAVVTLEALANLDFGAYSEIVVAMCAILINAIKEYRSGK